MTPGEIQQLGDSLALGMEAGMVLAACIGFVSAGLTHGAIDLLQAALWRGRAQARRRRLAAIRARRTVEAQQAVLRG